MTTVYQLTVKPLSASIALPALRMHVKCDHHTRPLVIVQQSYDLKFEASP